MTKYLIQLAYHADYPERAQRMADFLASLSAGVCAVEGVYERAELGTDPSQSQQMPGS
jgi:hypothetical protein